MKPVKHAMHVFWCLGGAGIGIGLLGAITNLDWLCIAGVLLIFAGLVYHIVRYRCPGCGRYLGRNIGHYCQYCGKEID